MRCIQHGDCGDCFQPRKSRQSARVQSVRAYKFAKRKWIRAIGISKVSKVHSFPQYSRSILCGYRSLGSFRRPQGHERVAPSPSQWLRLIAMGRSQGAQIDAAASKKARCDCDSGYLRARPAPCLVRVATLRQAPRAEQPGVDDLPLVPVASCSKIQKRSSRVL